MNKGVNKEKKMHMYTHTHEEKPNFAYTENC